MKVTLSSGAVLRVLGIVNNYPGNTRAMRTMIERLGSALDLTDDEKAVVAWQDLPNGQTRYQPDVPLEKELFDADVDLLRIMIDQPPDALAWRRLERPLFNEWAEALGMEAWG